MVTKNKTLLLVEDDFSLAILESKMLKDYGYKVEHVLSGEEAIEVMNQIPEIDLILMDINLGNGLDGTETAERILSDHSVPIVFLSSHIEKELIEKTEKITSYGYVLKSSHITVLDASIKMAFKLFNAHKKIVESENKFKDIFENTLDCIFILEVSEDLRYKVIALNPAELLQLKKLPIFNNRINHLNNNLETFENTDLEEFISSEIYSTLKINYDRCVSEGKIISYEEKLSNEKFYTQLIPVKDTKGKIHRIIGISRNISNLKLTND
jgi:CheY-like chemotaxis protein